MLRIAHPMSFVTSVDAVKLAASMIQNVCRAHSARLGDAYHHVSTIRIHVQSPLFARLVDAVLLTDVQQARTVRCRRLIVIG